MSPDVTKVGAWTLILHKPCTHSLRSFWDTLVYEPNSTSRLFAVAQLSIWHGPDPSVALTLSRVRVSSGEECTMLEVNEDVTVNEVGAAWNVNATLLPVPPSATVNV